jgi:hypothetical protein
MATYKMLKTKRGVRKGDVHSVVFHEGKTYEIDDDLAGEFTTLGAVEPSSEEPVVALIEDDNVNLHENWLDTDPAVLRHGELTAQEVVARDESANPQTTSPTAQVEGKAEGEVQPDAAAGQSDAGVTEDAAKAGSDGQYGKTKKTK